MRTVVQCIESQSLNKYRSPNQRIWPSFHLITCISPEMSLTYNAITHAWTQAVERILQTGVHPDAEKDEVSLLLVTHFQGRGSALECERDRGWGHVSGALGTRAFASLRITSVLGFHVPWVHHPSTRGLCLTLLSVCSHPLQKGWTPLHWAAEQDASKIAELLLQNKADPNAESKEVRHGGGVRNLRCWLYIAHASSPHQHHHTTS